LVVTVIVLGVLAVGVDRLAEWAAENRLATMAEDEAAKYDVEAADTSVEVGGFGFLPQLAKQEFSTVRMTMKDLTFTGISADDLQVDMTGVHVPRAVLKNEPGAHVTVDSTSMRLHLSPTELAALARRTTGVKGWTLRIVEGKLHAGLSVGGITVDAVVTPQAKAGRIVLAVEQMSDSVPEVAREAMTSKLREGIPVPRLPFGAYVTQAGIEGDSLVLVATVDNLRLT